MPVVSGLRWRLDDQTFVAGQCKPTGFLPSLRPGEKHALTQRRAVVPGDQLHLEAETLRLSGSRGRVQCRAVVAGKLVAECRLNFALAGSSQ